jgi:outer membrane immunogenic protein
VKKIFLAALATVALAASACAADLPLKAAPLPTAPFSWTGFYAGVNVGYSWGNARTDIAGSATAIAFADPFFGGGFPTSVAFADSNAARLNGAIGGGQIGYNYQFSPKWVLGFEADIQGSGERGSNTFVDPFSGPWCHSAFGPPPVCTLIQTINGTAVTTYEAKIGWFGTVRGRLGVLVTDQVLLYGTGGF